MTSFTQHPANRTYSLRTADGLVRTGPCKLIGFYVNSTSSGVIKFGDAVTSTAFINGDVTPAIGWHSMGEAYLSTGLYFELVSGSINVTIVYEKV